MVCSLSPNKPKKWNLFVGRKPNKTITNVSKWTNHLFCWETGTKKNKPFVFVRGKCKKQMVCYFAKTLNKGSDMNKPFVLLGNGIHENARKSGLLGNGEQTICFVGKPENSAQFVHSAWFVQFSPNKHKILEMIGGRAPKSMLRAKPIVRAPKSMLRTPKSMVRAPETMARCKNDSPSSKIDGPSSDTDGPSSKIDGPSSKNDGPSSEIDGPSFA